MPGDSRLAGGHPGEGAVPARLQLARDKAVLRIGRIVLPEGAIGGIAGRLEVANHSLACVVTLRAGLRLRSSRGFNGGPVALRSARTRRHRRHAGRQRRCSWAHHNRVGRGCRRSVGSGPWPRVYWTVSLPPQRRQRSRPASSAEPCLGAPREAAGTFSLTIVRIASARSQSM